jgi:hypothetical protein
MKKGYEGLTISLWMLFVAWTIVAVVKLMF